MSRPCNKAAPGHRREFLRALLAGDATKPCIYFMGWAGGPIKIGFARQLERRWQEIQVASPYPIFVWAAVTGGDTQERLYHYQFRDHRIRGEWFERCEAIETEILRLNASASRGHLRLVRTNPEQNVKLLTGKDQRC